MKLKKILHHLKYDEFGKKDYEGYILLAIFMSPTILVAFSIMTLLSML